MINPATGLEDPNYKKPKAITTGTGGMRSTDGLPPGAQNIGANPDRVYQDNTNIGGLGSQDYETLNAQFKNDIASGSTSAQATESLRNRLKQQGNFEQGKALYENNGVQPVSTTGVTPTGVPGAASTPTGTDTGTTGVIPTTGTTGTTGTTTPTGVLDTNDTNKDGILTADELDTSSRSVYDIMTEAEKKMFNDIGLNAKTKGQDWVKAQTTYLQQFKADKEYRAKQEQTRLKQTEIGTQVDEIQSSERIKKAQNDIDNMKQRIGYLGNRGQPGISAVKMDAVSRQLSQSENTFRNMQEVERLIGESKKLGRESDTLAYERQMTVLQDDLTSKVNKSIQSALNQFNSAEIAGKLDTIEEVEAFRVQLLGQLDKQITGVTDGNITQRAFLIERYDKIAADKKTYFKNSNEVNSDLSTVRGYYVDGNGNPFVSATTGQRINAPKAAPMKPIYDEKTGNLVTFSTGPDGGIIAKVDDLIKDSTFTESSIASFAALVAKGTLKIDDVPENVRKTEAFIQAMASAPGKGTGKREIVDQVWDENTETWRNVYGTTDEQGNVISREDGKGATRGGTTTTAGTAVGMKGTNNYSETLLKFSPTEQTARTNRHNNPTAFTSDIAKQGGLIEGVDYQAGESFGSKGQYKTALLLGDPIASTIKVIDNIGFKTQKGGDRWTYTAGIGLTNATWATMNTDQKTKAVGEMYVHETTPDKRNFDAYLSDKGSISQVSQEQGPKAYTVTDGALFDKFLSGKDNKDDTKTLKKLGYTRADIDAYASTKDGIFALGDDQRIEISKEKSAFRSNPVVKSFEESLTANRDLVSSLDSELKGPGDVAAVFMFMKSLDPQSVVREGEFALAASTAGYAGNVTKFLENLTNPNDKSWLVKENRESFRKLAKSYVENKAKSYDRVYDDMVNTVKYWKAPDALIPKRASDDIRQKVAATQPQRRWNTQDTTTPNTTPTQGRWQPNQ